MGPHSKRRHCHCPCFVFVAAAGRYYHHRYHCDYYCLAATMEMTTKNPYNPYFCDTT